MTVRQLIQQLAALHDPESEVLVRVVSDDTRRGDDHPLTTVAWTAGNEHTLLVGVQPANHVPAS